ncbi:hypothetical protein Acr_00g0062510 [Actinidia rufa]|uniref:Uncharacterized protein n=1 Tax=Actinidia rufa TaxID=165716 RepID=A0A7J0DNY7_9ERIC|nr:hypothetical protein Acr_00g0062510 [Actinidia rufa]
MKCDARKVSIVDMASAHIAADLMSEDRDDTMHASAAAQFRTGMHYLCGSGRLWGGETLMGNAADAGDIRQQLALDPSSVRGKEIDFRGRRGRGDLLSYGIRDAEDGGEGATIGGESGAEECGDVGTSRVPGLYRMSISRDRDEGFDYMHVIPLFGCLQRTSGDADNGESIRGGEVCVRRFERTNSGSEDVFGERGRGSRISSRAWRAAGHRQKPSAMDCQCGYVRAEYGNRSSIAARWHSVIDTYSSMEQCDDVNGMGNSIAVRGEMSRLVRLAAEECQASNISTRLWSAAVPEYACKISTEAELHSCTRQQRVIEGLRCGACLSWRYDIRDRAVADGHGASRVDRGLSSDCAAAGVAVDA